MKDPGQTVYKAVFSALNGKIYSAYVDAFLYTQKAQSNGSSGGGLTCALESFEALAGAETALPVYSVMPDGVSGPYVYLSDFEYSEDDAKDRFMYFGTMQIQIVYPMEGPANDKTLLNTYASWVSTLLRPLVNSTLDLTPDFSNTYLYIQNNRELSNLFDDDRTVRRVMQLTLGIEQL